MNKSEFRNVPQSALQFVCGDCNFGDNGDNAKTAPFKMTARTGDVISHPFWGNIVHDNSGLVLHKNRTTIDYNHNSEEILGWANHIEVVNGDLVAGGVLQSVREGDRASEVIARGKAGQPYEASISHDGDIELEEIPEHYTTEVNGRQISGPAIIIRKYNLRGIAVVPYGADKNTATELNACKEIKVKVYNTMDKESNDSVESVELNESNEQVIMKDIEIKEIPEAIEVESVEVVTELNTQIEVETLSAPVETEITPVVEAVVEEVADVVLAAVESQVSNGQLFIAEFGEQGAIWFAEGKTYDEAKNQFVANLKAENTELRNRLSALACCGEEKPVSFSAEVVEVGGVDASRVEKFSKVMGDNLAAFAASIKLPKQ